MPIIDYLERNAREFGDDVALVEINPDVTETRRVTWREYELIEANPTCQYRREITWNVFNEKANRFANLLVSRGIQKDRYPDDELSGMASNLFWSIKDRSFGSAA